MFRPTIFFRKTAVFLVCLSLLPATTEVFAARLPGHHQARFLPEKPRYKPVRFRNYRARFFYKNPRNFFRPFLKGLKHIYMSGLINRRLSPTVTVIQTPPTNTAFLSAAILQPSGTNILPITILNPNGSYTQVTLTKYGEGYIGPQGEYYQGNPSIEQLKFLYTE